MPSGLKRWHTFGDDHFITFTCYHQFPYLDNDHAKQIFLSELEILRKRHGFELYAYVLMPNHVHLLLSEPKQQKLEDTFRVLKTQTARKLKGTREHFWQRRYYDRNVSTQKEFVEKLKYIHRNPVRSHLTTRPEDYPWSSFNHWVTGQKGPVQIESHWTWREREESGSK